MAGEGEHSTSGGAIVLYVALRWSPLFVVLVSTYTWENVTLRESRNEAD